MALANLARTQKNAVTLKSVIAEAFEETGRTLYPFDLEKVEKMEQFVRSSSLYALCPREEVLASLLKIERTKEVTADLGEIFAHGTALHDYLRNSVLANSGVLLGQWKCTTCGKKHGGAVPGKSLEQTLRPKPKACSRCKETDFLYVEIELEDRALGLRGHVDGFLRLRGRPGLGIFELKSISAYGSAKIRYAPQTGHVVQVHSYMMMSGARWGIILYWEKAGTGMSAFREHDVDYDAATVKIIRDNVSAIWGGIRMNVLPERICDTSTCERAKGCSLRAQCFALAHKVIDG